MMRHEIYADNYGYRSGLNQSMVNHLRQRASAALQIAKPGPGDILLDIASNDCTLLRAIPPN